MRMIKAIDNRYYREIGRQLKRIREERQMSLREVAKATGYSRTTIDCWELGMSRIKENQFEQLCKVYDITNNISVNVKIGFLLDD